MNRFFVICVCALLCNVLPSGATSPEAGPQKSASSFYDSAFREISGMLDGTERLSVKRAVFLQEWAYLDGELDYDEYCSGIDSTAQAIIRFIRANNLQNFRTGGNYALFEYFSRPYSMNGYKPFTYDFDDFSGADDFTKLFVTKVMRTHSGQCRSLPMYYKVLAEAIGTEAHITFAPQHLFIRHRDEQNPSKWVNVELTTQSLSRELFYIEQFGINADEIRNKVYLYPLSDKETVAYLLAEMILGYYRKYGKYDTFILNCAEKSLEYYPHNVLALQQKCNVLNVRLMDYLSQNGNHFDDRAREMDEKWLANNEKLQALGWKQMADSTYLGLIRSVEEDMKRKGIDSLSRQRTISKLKKNK